MERGNDSAATGRETAGAEDAAGSLVVTCIEEDQDWAAWVTSHLDNLGIGSTVEELPAGGEAALFVIDDLRNEDDVILVVSRGLLRGLPDRRTMQDGGQVGENRGPDNATRAHGLIVVQIEELALPAEFAGAALAPMHLAANDYHRSRDLLVAALQSIRHASRPTPDPAPVIARRPPLPAPTLLLAPAYPAPEPVDPVTPASIVPAAEPLPSHANGVVEDGAPGADADRAEEESPDVLSMPSVGLLTTDWSARPWETPVEAPEPTAPGTTPRVLRLPLTPPSPFVGRLDVLARLAADVVRTLTHDADVPPTTETTETTETEGGAESGRFIPIPPGLFPQPSARERVHGHAPSTGGLVTIDLRDRDAELPIVTLTGAAGIGKTSVALEHATRHLGALDVLWWIRGGSRATVLADLRALGTALHLPAADTATAVLNAREWLESTGERWILVIDDARAWADLADLIPRRGTGQLLITGAPSFLPAEGDVVELGGLSTAHAVELLAGSPEGSPADNAALEDVAMALGRRPWALALAAAHLQNTGAGHRDQATAGYLAALDLAPSALPTTSALGSAVPASATDAAVVVSLADLEQASVTAAAVIVASCSLSSDPFPAADLEHIADPGQSLVELGARSRLLQRGDDLVVVCSAVRDVLRRVRPVGSGSRAVAFAAELLTGELATDADADALDRYAPHVLEVLDGADDVGFSSPGLARLGVLAASWLTDLGDLAAAADRWRSVLAMCESELGENDELTRHARRTLGLVHTDLGDHDAAVQIQLRVVADLERNAGFDDLRTLRARANLAAGYLLVGAHDKAEIEATRAVEGLRNRLGPVHPDTVAAAHTLALATPAAALARANAESVFALADAPPSSPPLPAPLTLAAPLALPDLALPDLALPDLALPDLAGSAAIEALVPPPPPPPPAPFRDTDTDIAPPPPPLPSRRGGAPSAPLTSATGISGPTDGPPADAPTLPTALSVPAPTPMPVAAERPSVGLSVPAPHVAEPLLVGPASAALSGLVTQLTAEARRSEDELGATHPDSLRAWRRLGAAYTESGQYTAALDPFERLVRGHEQAFGPDDLRTLTARNDLANAFATAGQHARALQLLQRVVNDASRVYGPTHPGTLTAKHNLANSYADVGRNDDALQLRREVVREREGVLGADHPQTIGARNNLANSLAELGEVAEALDLRQEVVNARTRLLGSEHPQTLGAINNLANSHADLGHHDVALRLRQDVLATRERVLGADHPHTLTARNNLANSYAALGRHQEAFALRQQALVDCERTLGVDHPHTQTARANLAASVSALRKGDVVGYDQAVTSGGSAPSGGPVGLAPPPPPPVGPAGLPQRRSAADNGIGTGPGTGSVSPTWQPPAPPAPTPGPAGQSGQPSPATIAATLGRERTWTSPVEHGGSMFGTVGGGTGNGQGTVGNPPTRSGSTETATGSGSTDGPRKRRRFWFFSRR